MFFSVGHAYLSEYSIDVDAVSSSISKNCIVYTYNNSTVLRFHSGRELHANRTSKTIKVNDDCSMVLFGYPQENKVVQWAPLDGYEKIVEPNVDVDVARFGFSLDIYNRTWVVGAPGQPNNITGQGATMGYAFVYYEDQLHSCRSLYDMYCYGSECDVGYHSMKMYYSLADDDVPAFQQACASPQLPQYDTGPMDMNLLQYFPQRQFGYAVALTGSIYDTDTKLFVSAPGDTRRFMEDNTGQNYGRVYTWRADSVADGQRTWWQMLAESPLAPVELPGVTYRAYGRDVSAVGNHLTVSSYPLYDEPLEPFITIFRCDQTCRPIPQRGIAVNDFPDNILGYLTPSELSYTDGKTLWPYIPSDVPDDGLSDFQNEFIGSNVGVVGSNIIVPSFELGVAYRFGTNVNFREKHAFDGSVAIDTHSEHWLHGSQNGSLVHLWNCPVGRVGRRNECSPCPKTYFSDDGWQRDCEVCPTNSTTVTIGQTECQPWVRESPPAFTWENVLTICAVIIMSTVGCAVICTLCTQTGRTARHFVDE